MACESLEIMEMTPMSCRTFSAATVSARTRLSAKETSEGTFGFRLWQTMIMSNSSDCVLTPKGRVGLVELGSTLGWPATFRMSGAWPPPAPSVWKVWMTRPAMASMVSSTYPASFRVSVWTETCTSMSSATLRAARIMEGMAPQSSCTLKPHAPASICSTSGTES